MLNFSAKGLVNQGQSYIYLGSNIVYSNSSSDPTSPTPTAGARYYNTTSKVEKFYDGTSWIVPGGSGTGSSLDVVPHISGLVLSPNSSHPTYQIDISTGTCSNSSNDGYMLVSSVITVDLTSSGVNGLDTSSESSSKWYFIYLIYNPTSGLVRGLISASSSSPTLPSGYTKKRLIGSFRNDSSSNIIDFEFSREGDSAVYLWGNKDEYYRTVYDSSSSGFTDIDLSTWISPLSERAYLFYSSTSVSVNKDIRPNGYTCKYCAMPTGSTYNEFTIWMYAPGRIIEQRGISGKVVVMGYKEVL